MKPTDIFIIRFLTAILVISTVACSSGGDTDDEITDSKAEYVFPEPLLDWKATITSIQSRMKQKDCITVFERTEHEHVSIYKQKGEDVYFSYAFRDGELNTVNVILEAEDYAKKDVLKAFKGYDRLTDLGSEVYLNRKSNVVATLTTVENKGIEYYNLGWSRSDVEVANAIDLGLSVKWADRNVSSNTDVSAASEEDYGELIGWGDPTGIKTSESISNYPCYSDISATAYDVARKQWGDGWRMPTHQEMLELMTSCNWQWTSINGVDGYNITGPNGKSIFLPTTGYRKGDVYYGLGTYGYYWTSTHRDQNSLYPYVLNFNKNSHGINYSAGSMLAYPTRAHGCAIRPVTE